jgi:hypothetical protein
MQKEYLASVETEFGLRHNLVKYTLSNGVEVVLSDDEMEELFKGSKLGSEIEILKSENQKLEYQRDYYKSLIKDFNHILDQMQGI